MPRASDGREKHSVGRYLGTDMRDRGQARDHGGHMAILDINCATGTGRLLLTVVILLF